MAETPLKRLMFKGQRKMQICPKSDLSKVLYIHILCCEVAVVLIFGTNVHFYMQFL